MRAVIAAGGHKRPHLPCRRARERFRCQVVVKFFLQNSPVDLGVRQWNPGADDVDPNVKTLFSTVQHHTAYDAQFAVKP